MYTLKVTHNGEGGAIATGTLNSVKVSMVNGLRAARTELVNLFMLRDFNDQALRDDIHQLDCAINWALDLHYTDFDVPRSRAYSIELGGHGITGGTVSRYEITFGEETQHGILHHGVTYP